MANDDNLRKLTTDEAREIGKKGGVNSGKARREKKEMREFAKMVLDELVKDKKTGKQVPTRYAMVKRLVQKVLKDGDVQAFKTIAAQVGEQPKEANNNVVIINNYNGLTAEAQDALEHIDEL